MKVLFEIQAGRNEKRIESRHRIAALLAAAHWIDMNELKTLAFRRAGSQPLDHGGTRQHCELS
jgi:hypothetical protein